MCIADGDYCDLWVETRPKARKQHHCGECGRTIEAGERYLRIGMVWEGRGDSAKMCAHCDAAADWLRKVCQGFYAGGVAMELQEHIDEHSYPVRTLSLYRLADGMRRRWQGVAVEAVQRWAANGARLALAEGE